MWCTKKQMKIHLGESVGLEMTAKTEESHHSTSRECSFHPVTQASGVGQQGGVYALSEGLMT